MPSTAEQAIYDRLISAPLFHPSTASLVANDWSLDPGDIVTVNSGEESYNVPVYSLDFHWAGSNQNGSCAATTTKVTIESTGGQTREPLPELRRREYANASRAYGAYSALKNQSEEEFRRFETFYSQTDEKFSWLATESEWDELAQSGHVTAFTELTRTARYVEDSAKMELPYDDWKTKWLIVHPEDSSLTDEELQEKYGAWIKENPYAIYNSAYSDATRTERIIAKTGINSLGENETIASRVTQTADTLRSEIANSSSTLYTTLEQSLSGFRSEVGDTLNGYSATISQSANTIRAEVHSAISDIYARIIEWEGGGAIEVREGNLVFKQWSDPTTTETEDLMAGDVWVKSNDTRTWAEAGVNTWNSSEIYEWADYRGDELYVWKDGRWQLVVSAKDLVVQGSRLEVGQQEIWAVVDDDRNNLRAEISLTASRFYRTLTDTANGLNSTITQTASQIRTEVSDANNGVYSYINQEADRIESVVENTASGLRSSITQTASQIMSEVNSSVNSVKSSITQQANRIDLVVQGTGSNAAIKPAAIVAAINNAASTVIISADHINLDGYVTMSDLSAVSADIEKLTTGQTVATSLKANFLEATNTLTVGQNGYKACLLYYGSGNSQVSWGTVLGTSSGGINVNHYHTITATEGTGSNAGKITLTLGAVRSSQGTANFNIADTAYFQNAMSARWAEARAKVQMPAQGTSTSFDVKVPSATVGGQETKTFTIQKGATPGPSGYASVALNNIVVGRISIGDWYTAGKEDSDVYITQDGGWASGSWYVYPGDDYYFYPANFINGDFNINYDRGIRIIAQGGGGGTINVQEARHASGIFAYNFNIKVKVNGTVYTVQSQPLSASEWAAY